jgi:hypothetical protein
VCEDGRYLEDYLDALAFVQAGGVVPAAEWVEELRRARSAASLAPLFGG